LTHLFVMAGPVPAIHVFTAAKTWMPGIRPGMTNFEALLTCNDGIRGDYSSRHPPARFRLRTNYAFAAACGQ
jgi:hypothetical protein